MQEFITIPTSLISELPDDKRLALLDILLMAGENGEFYSTTRKLMERWKWGNTKTVKFFKFLEEQDICKTQTRHRQDTLYRINTGFFNSSQYTNKTQTRHKQDTIEEVKKVKKEEDTFLAERKQIIEYLNQKCGTKYRHGSDTNKKHINARLNDGYAVDDFFKVIDKKYDEWHGTEQEKYLRPETLFGNKFESYLNQKINKEKPKNGFNNFPQREYNLGDLERNLLRR